MATKHIKVIIHIFQYVQIINYNNCHYIKLLLLLLLIVTNYTSAFYLNKRQSLVCSNRIILVEIVIFLN